MVPYLLLYLLLDSDGHLSKTNISLKQTQCAA